MSDSWQDLSKTYIRNYGTSPAVFAVNVPADYTTVGTREINGVKGQPTFLIAINPGNSDTQMSVNVSTNPCEGAFDQANSFGDWTPSHSVYTIDDPRAAKDTAASKLVLIPGQVNYIMVWPTPNYNKFSNPSYAWNFGAGFRNAPNFGGNGTLQSSQNSNSTYATFPTGTTAYLSPAGTS
jgi:hypothetical protein